MAEVSLSMFYIFVLFVCLAAGCEYHPSLWCSSKDIASECKVTDQCRNFVWKHNEVDEHYYYAPAKPVEVGFYYEVLCPGCKFIMNSQLWKTYKAIPDIFNVDFVPYGNAKEKFVDGKWQFTCQHGEEECSGNLVHTCALHVFPSNVTFEFIACMESHGSSVLVAAEKCSSNLGLNFDDLVKCSSSLEGNQLQFQMAVKTHSLEPRHKYVPWITINGVHTEEIQDEASKDLLGLICRTYKGQKPAACDQKQNKVRRCLRSSS